MKLWISKSSEVPMQEQLATQLILGIVSGDLPSGERLPSTTQIARRFHIHANTVRACYRDLASRGWVEWRSGSGFYVISPQTRKAMSSDVDLDHLISSFFDIARGRGHTLKEIQNRIQRWFSAQAPDHILVVEPDPDLREIVIAELTGITGLPVTGVGMETPIEARQLIGAFCVALYDHAEEMRTVLPPEVGCLPLRSRSIARSLAGESRPAADTTVTVVSRWPDFLSWARTTLVAVGLDANALDLRDGRKRGWDRGLTHRAFIISDSLMARRLPAGCRPRVFRVLSDESVEELKTRLSGRSG